MTPVKPVRQKEPNSLSQRVQNVEVGDAMGDELTFY